MKAVLFLCTGNSARSQMAEGILRRLAGDRFEAFSAGVKPTSVNPLAVKVMKEIGVDISEHTSKSITLFLDSQFDYVITLCDNAKQTCPLFPGKHVLLHWDIEDPATATGTEEEKLEVFRKARNAITANIERIITGR